MKNRVSPDRLEEIPYFPGKSLMLFSLTQPMFRV